MEKAAVEPPAGRLFNTDRNWNPRLAEPGNALAAHQRIGVFRADDHFAYPGFDERLGTRRRLAPMGTWFEVDIHRGLRKQRAIFRGQSAQGLNLRMGLARSVVVSFSEYTAFMHNQCPDPRVGVDISAGLLGER